MRQRWRPYVSRTRIFRSSPSISIPEPRWRSPRRSNRPRPPTRRVDEPCGTSKRGNGASNGTLQLGWAPGSVHLPSLDVPQVGELVGAHVAGATNAFAEGHVRGAGIVVDR